MEKQKIEEIVEKLDHAEALSEAARARRGARSAARGRGGVLPRGLQSGFISWRLCVVFDGLGELELALKYVQEALRRDPFAPPFRSSFGIIVGRIRKAILGAEPG